MSSHCLKSFEVWVSFGKSQSSLWSAKQCDLAPLTSVNSWPCPLLILPSLVTFSLAELYVRNALPPDSLLTQFPYFISASVQMLPSREAFLTTLSIRGVFQIHYHCSPWHMGVLVSGQQLAQGWENGSIQVSFVCVCACWLQWSECFYHDQF